MIDPNTNLKDFPPWVWPYINVARLADFHKEAGRFKGAAEISTPEPAIAAHVMTIIAAITMKKFVASLKLKDADIQKQFEQAASRGLSTAIDDCGNGRPKPWPIPPRHIQLHEIAARLAIAAAELEGDELMRDELRGVVTQLVDMAGR